MICDSCKEFLNHQVPAHVIAFAIKQFREGDCDVDLHGPKHWGQVLHNGLTLAKQDPEIDPVVVAHFAVLHDCCRVNDSADPFHGQRAVRVMTVDGQLDFDHLSDSQLAKLIRAIMRHSEGGKSDDQTIGACWDADRLDLSRPGVDVLPLPRYMSTRQGLELCVTRNKKKEALDVDW